MSQMNLARLAKAANAPTEVFVSWAQEEPPEEMDPRVWADALGHRALHANPWPTEALDKCTRYAPNTLVAPVGRKSRSVREAA